MLGEGVLTPHVGEESGVGEAEIIRLAEDDMVEHPDSEDLRRRRQPVGAFAVFPRWVRISRRMVVQEYDGSRILQNSGLENFPWVYDRGGEASHADRMVADRPVFAVERDHEKELTVEGGELLAECFEEFAGVLVFREASNNLHLLLNQAKSIMSSG